MGEHNQGNQCQQDVNQLLKVRREKLGCAAGGGKGSVSDYEI